METPFIDTVNKRIKFLEEELSALKKLKELYQRNESLNKFGGKPPPLRFRPADPRVLYGKNELYTCIRDFQNSGRLGKWFMVKDLAKVAPSGYSSSSMSTISVGLHHLYRRHVLAILKLRGKSRASLYTSDLTLIHYNKDLEKWEVSDTQSIPEEYQQLFKEAEVEVLFQG